MLDSESLLYVVALRDLFATSQHRLREWLRAYPRPAEAWERLNMAGKQASLERAKQEMEFIERHHIRTAYFYDDDYPTRLKQCTDAPVLLFIKGNVDTENGHFVSIVGTRQATDRGRIFTRELIIHLAEKLPRLTIVSGLAYGIDIAAHRAAMEIGIPTLIIPAHGLDRIYPAVHRNDAVRALEHGGIITEYPSGTTPERYNFVARNRIIAGLSDCTVIVESRQQGGALITATMAADYDRTVFAVPGRVQDECSAGCNTLIRDQRAILLQTADDLLSAMNWLPKYAAQTTLNLPDGDRQTCANTSHLTTADETTLSEDELQILGIVRQAENGVTANDLVEEIQLPYHGICSTLMLLEVKQFVKSFPGGTFMAVR